MGALFLVPKRVRLLSRATILVGLLSRVLFWALFEGLSFHQNNNAISCQSLFFQSFLGLLRPFQANFFIYFELPRSFEASSLYKKIHCTVQNSLNGCSLHDSVVCLGCSPNELVVQLEQSKRLCSPNGGSPNVIGSPIGFSPNGFVVQTLIVQM